MLRVQWQQGYEEPRDSVREATIHRRISEVEWLALACGRTVTRLCGLRDLIKELPQLGKVKAVTGNCQAVHEKVGQYQTIKLLGSQGYIQGDSINLRLFLNHWHYGFAVKEKRDDSFYHSLQFFDRDGTGIHKIYLTEESCWEAYQNLVSCYQSLDQSPRQSVAPVPRFSLPVAREVDIPLFRQAWLSCQDIHDLPALFKNFGITRIQGLRLAGPELAVPIILPDLRVFMEVLRDAALPVALYVSNQGIMQSHTGVVKQLYMTGPWYIALDNNFTLYLRETDILQAWIVRQPASEGARASFELYNEAGENILQLFSHCSPGQIEYETWQRLLAALETAPNLAYNSTLQAV